ncbi:hypothetical protein RN001_012840 [Aquatica leii]|uniref:RETREG1-3/ARL6IP-like N-terminal reticulon-homology domain-containing protein n=1 Tax=Aquatica leii TaxID=1421715 RepID=A0AAN7SMM6_9COLE|nr:hypothetical protein RN001_012840 [Aquatica leii]
MDVQQEVQTSRLKDSLESWREIVLVVHSVLLWEKNWYPGAIIGGSTFLFLNLWVLDPSILTTISILGLTITISDYLVPIVTSAIFKPESWTKDKDEDLINICRKVVEYKSKLEISSQCFYEMRCTKPKMYYGFTILTMLFMAWIGNSFNNLFLTYLFITTLLLIPGLEHHGIIKKYGTAISNKLSEYSKLKLLSPKKEQ